MKQKSKPTGNKLSKADQNKLRQKQQKLPPLPENKSGEILGTVFSPYKRWRSHY